MGMTLETAWQGQAFAQVGFVCLSWTPWGSPINQSPLGTAPGFYQGNVCTILFGFVVTYIWIYCFTYINSNICIVMTMIYCYYKCISLLLCLLLDPWEIWWFLFFNFLYQVKVSQTRIYESYNQGHMAITFWALFQTLAVENGPPGHPHSHDPHVT